MISSLPHLLYHQGLRYSETTAQLSKDVKGVFQPTSYKELMNQMLDFAGGLVTLGTKKGEHIGHISDNRAEWQVVSLGIMAISCSDIPRGTDVTTKELAYHLISFNIAAYLRHIKNDKENAELFYSLGSNYSFLTNILRKSIYEYFISKRYLLKNQRKSKNLFEKKLTNTNEDFELLQLDMIISSIESRWVDNA